MNQDDPLRGTSRRAVLGALGVSLAWAGARTAFGQGASAQQLTLTVNADHVLADVPANYTGLSYEAAQLMHADFFSRSNTGLVNLCRTLGTRGVLRLGGNTSAFTTFAQTGASTDAGGYGPDKGTHASQQRPGMYVITPQALRQLRTFLDATGWDLIYGLNLRHGTPESAADEAAAVAQVCGPKLLALQFGNEPDLFRDAPDATHPRGVPWSFDRYIAAWKAMYQAVHARVPHAPIAGPDSAANKEYAARFTAATKGDVALITTHYYAEGPPTDPRMTIDYLLHPGTRIQTAIYDAMAAAKAAGLPYRMSEGNSCYNGGKPGVSDTFASALWAGDFMLDLAARGSTGVNLHGGAEGAYTPIATDQGGASSARPDFYGMWLAGQFARRRMVRTDLAAPSGDSLQQDNVTAYAAKDAHGSLAAVFNKGAADLKLELKGMPVSGEVYRLRAASLAATNGVTLGRGSRDASAVWTMQPDEHMTGGQLMLPAASAVLIRRR